MHKTEATVWSELFQMQRDLNTLTFTKSVPSGKALSNLLWKTNNPPAKIFSLLEHWILQFSRAAWHEVHEAELLIQMRVSIHDEDEKAWLAEEIIDILHFTTSMCILSGISHQEIEQQIENLDKMDPELKEAMLTEHLYDQAFEIRDALIKTERALNWKWWSKRKEVDKNLLKKDILHANMATIYLLMSLGITQEGILENYKSKHAINVLRQQTGYTAGI